jgi:hypothetical protein
VERHLANPSILKFYLNMFHQVPSPKSLSFTIHTDLNIPFISDLIKTRFQQFHSRLFIQPNPLAQALSSPYHPLHPPRRLNRQWPRDLLWGIAIGSVTDGWLLPSRPHAIIYFCNFVLITLFLVDCTNKDLLKKKKKFITYFAPSRYKSFHNLL